MIWPKPPRGTRGPRGEKYEMDSGDCRAYRYNR